MFDDRFNSIEIIWITILLCFPSLAAGLLLLVGGINNNALATLSNLIITAILIVLNVGIGLMLFAFYPQPAPSLPYEHREMINNLIAATTVILTINTILDVYFWICVHSFFLTLDQ